MGATWIVSANASRARFFSQANAAAPLEEIHDMVNEAGRLRMLETTESDKRGPTAATKSMHNTGGALPNKLYEPPKTPDVVENEVFAKDLINFLEKAHQEGRFQQLCLVISPQFLGMVRKLLGKNLESLVQLEINKDYTQSSPKELLEHIEANKP